ncbi:MAG: DUF5615 family PIN-like protein [Parvibaculaceae bacterium]
MKFVVDMNLSPDWTGFLNNAGHDAVHWQDVGAVDAPDTDVLTWARDNDHVLLTCDLDFGAILAASHHVKPSVIQLRSDSLRHANVGDLVLSSIESAKFSLAVGALLSIDVDRARLRILPLSESK